MMKKALSLCTVVASVTWGTSALGAGFATARYTAEHGHPMTSNGSAIYFNPAAITRGDGSAFLIDGSVAIRSVSYDRPGHSTDIAPPAGYESANVGKADLFNVLAGPTLAFTTKLGDLGLGAGIHAPFGGFASWNKNDEFVDDSRFAGPEDGVQRWYAISGRLSSIYFTLAGAYEFADQFSFGVALNLIRSAVETSRARVLTGGTNSLTDEGRSVLVVDGTQWSFGAGVLYEPMKDELWIGVSYQAQPNISGGMTLEGKQQSLFPDPAGGEPQVLDDNAQLHQTYPDIVRAGVAFRVQPLIELRLFGDYQRWSVFKNQCVGKRLSSESEVGDCEVDENGATTKGTVLQNAKRDWNDTFGVRAGISYWTDEKRDLELFGGLGFDGNAVPDETLEPALYDSTKLSAAAGARFGLADSLHLGASYTHLQYLPRDNTGKSRQTEFEGQTRGPDAGGEYNSWVGVLNVNLEVGF